jgi:hypothetical protein
MRRRRTLPIVLVVLLIAAAIALAVFLRRQAPPEPARLLPGADAFVFVNLKTVRSTDSLGDLAPVTHEPEYDQFIRETGFQFERDLDAVAFAVHYPSTQLGAPNPASSNPAQDQPRFSEVFVGHVEAERINNYLRKISRQQELYRGVKIFIIPLEGRTVRAAMLGVREVAVSNTDGTQVIHGMIDRYKKLASPFAGPQLLRSYYKKLPHDAIAWAIVSGPSGPPSAAAQLPSTVLGSEYRDLLTGSVILASLHYDKALQLRAAAYCPSEEKASRLADRMGIFLELFRGMQSNVGRGVGDQDVKQFFDSLRVEQQGKNAILTASVPVGFIKKAIAEGPPTTAAPAPPPPQPPAPSKGKNRKGRTGRSTKPK